MPYYILSEINYAALGDTILSGFTKAAANYLLLDNEIYTARGGLASLDARFDVLEAVMSSYAMEWVPAGHMMTRATNGPAAGTVEYTTTNDVNRTYFAFDSATDEAAQWHWVPPENWDGGTLKAKFYWSSASTTGTAGQVCIWGMRGKIADNSGVIDASYGTAVTVSDVLLANGGAATSKDHITSATGACTLSGTYASGCGVDLEFYRDADSLSDTLVGDAWLYGVMLKYGTTGKIATW